MFRASAPQVERDFSNFDCRSVAIFAIMATRPDLLNQYLTDGAVKEADGVTPAALRNPKLWRSLRLLGLPPALLADYLTFFERPEVQAAMQVAQVTFASMCSLDDYCAVGCPPDDWLSVFIPFCKQSGHVLNRPGIEVEPGLEVESHA